MVAAAGILAPGGLDAQERAPERLTFEAAVGMALDNNPTYLRQLNAVESAEYSEQQSFGSLLPSLNGSLGFGGSTSRNKTAVDELGRPLEEPNFVENTTSNASQSVSGSLQLFNLQTLRSYGAAQAQTDAQVAAAGFQAAQLRTQVGRAFFDVVQQEQLVAVAERSLATAEDQLNAVQELLRVAARQPTDVLGAELDVAQAEQALQEAQGNARKARLTLYERMGVDMDAAYQVVGGFREVFDPSELDAAALIDRALRESPRMDQQRASVAAAERNLGAARAARFPSVSGSYSYGRGTSARDYDAIGTFDLPNSSWGFNLSLSIPLFNRFQTTAAVGRAEVEASNARETMREARLAVERETRAALIDLGNAYTAVRLAERSADIARERLRQGQEQYRNGTLDYTALQQMINAVAQEERRVTSSYYAFAVALLDLEEKVGGAVRSTP